MLYPTSDFEINEAVTGFEIAAVASGRVVKK